MPLEAMQAHVIICRLSIILYSTISFSLEAGTGNVHKLKIGFPDDNYITNKYQY
jgi:hypothetical protein